MLASNIYRRLSGSACQFDDISMTTEVIKNHAAGPLCYFYPLAELFLDTESLILVFLSGVLRKS
jgi:hypothetical protein